MTQLLVFGDSIAYGAWDREGGWVQRLREFLDEKYLSNSNNFYYLVYNLSISGDITNDLLKRFEFETEQRLKEQEDEQIVIFAIGSNDSDFVHSKKDFLVHPVKFEKNIKKLTYIARKFFRKIIFVGYTPVDESKTCPIPYDTDKSCKNENLQKYDQIIKSVCEENKIPFVKIFENWIKLNYKNLLEDGLHPNSDGHKKIFESVKESLIKNKII